MYIIFWTQTLTTQEEQLSATACKRWIMRRTNRELGITTPVWDTWKQKSQRNYHILWRLCQDAEKLVWWKINTINTSNLCISTHIVHCELVQHRVSGRESHRRIHNPFLTVCISDPDADTCWEAVSSVQNEEGSSVVLDARMRLGVNRWSDGTQISFDFSLPILALIQIFHVNFLVSQKLSN